MNRWLIVGAGFTGAVLAERIASVLEQRVLLIDRRQHVGGNAHDYLDAHGILVHRYGPHIFHTNAPRVVEYLSQFTSWRPYEQRTLAWVDHRFVPVPFNFTSMEIIFGRSEGARLNKLLADEYGTEVKVPILKMIASPDQQIRAVAGQIYEKIFLHYTTKQWGLGPTELDPSVSARVPVHLSRDDRYFQDTFQKMPAHGYTRLFERMLDNRLIDIRLGAEFSETVTTETFHRIVFTGPIDEFFDRVHGPLPYRSLRFELTTIPGDGLAQECGVYNYPTPRSMHPFTRVTEFRHLTGQSGIGATTLATEYPEAYEPGRNEPYYPIPREENREVFRRYQAEAGGLRAVLFAGRLADYSYYNMDQAVGRALAVFEKQLLPDARAGGGGQ